MPRYSCEKCKKSFDVEVSRGPTPGQVVHGGCGGRALHASLPGRHRVLSVEDQAHLEAERKRRQQHDPKAAPRKVDGCFTQLPPLDPVRGLKKLNDPKWIAKMRDEGKREIDVMYGLGKRKKNFLLR